MLKVITLLNEKGGVGKTTLSATIGAGLAEMGHRVLMIDADGQGDLTVNMRQGRAPHFYDFVKRENIATKHLIQRVPQDVADGQLYVVAGNEETNGIISTSKLAEIARNITRRLHQLRNAFDYVVIDTSPSPTALHDAIILVTDFVIIPTDAEAFSALGGLPRTIENIEFMRQQALTHGHDKGRIIGIVPNKFRQTTALHRHFVDKLCQQYGELVWSPMPLRTAIAESQLLQEYLPSGELQSTHTAKMMRGFVKKVENITQGQAIND